MNTGEHSFPGTSILNTPRISGFEGKEEKNQLQAGTDEPSSFFMKGGRLLTLFLLLLLFFLPDLTLFKVFQN